jgi:hypothetical protein
MLRARQSAERIAGMAEDHVEAVQRQLQPEAGADRLLVRPIDLRLKTRAPSQTAPGHVERPRPLDIPADGLVAALEPIVADEVLVDAGR